MRKAALFFVIISLVLSNFVCFPVYGASPGIKIIVRGEPLTLQNAPVKESGCIMAPLRPVLESLDAHIAYDGKTKTITASKGKTVIKLTIGSKTAYKNGSQVKLDVAPKTVNKQTYAPLRFMFESFGAKMAWDEKTGTAVVTVDGSQEQRGNTIGNIANGGYVGASGDWIYVSLTGKGLWKIKKDGSKKIKILDESISYINIVGEWIYFSNAGIYKMKLDGSSKKMLSKNTATYLNVVGDWIYYINLDDAFKPYKIGLNGEDNLKVSDSSTMNMIVDAGWIYFINSEDSKLYKMRTNGSDIKELAGTSGVFGISNISKAGDWIYFNTVLENSGIYKIKTDGTGKKLIVKGYVRSYNISDGWLYYNNSSGSLYKFSEDKDQRIKIGRNISGNLNVSGDWVYYTEFAFPLENCKVYRIKADGSVKQRLDKPGALTDIIIPDYSNFVPTPKPITVPSTAPQTTVLSPKEIAKQRDAVVFIRTYDEDGNEISSGSGFNISGSGVVVTNFHVISGASSIKCTLSDDTKYEVDYVLNYSTIKDIAILQLKNASNLPFLRLGDSDKIELAEDVVAIGNPMELQNTVSTGIVSGIRNILGINLIQTTASISPGSSGGPLFNSYGEVIGITSMSILGSQDINFAVPINSVKKLFASAAVYPIDYMLNLESSIEEFEPNDSMETSNGFAPDQVISGSFADGKDADYYRFTMSNAGKISFFGMFNDILSTAKLVNEFSMSLIDKDGKEIARSAKTTENEIDLQKISVNLDKGTYYIVVKRTNPNKKTIKQSDYSVLTILD